MPADISHKRLRVYQRALDLVEESYRLSKLFPEEEKYNLSKQIQRAVLSVILNIAEGSARLTIADRKRFYEIGRGSLAEVDTGFTVSERLKYLGKADLENVTAMINDVFFMLSRMISTLTEMNKKN
jgi:four helix bundle protein